MAVKLSKLPSPPKEYVIEFPRLDGGLNLLELPYRMDANESPDMENLWWRDGALCCRDGQTRLTPDGDVGTAYSAYEGTFWGYGFFHIGDMLCAAPLDDPDLPAGELQLTSVIENVPEEAGTWFRYGDKLYYKCPGRYVEIAYDPEGDPAPDLLSIFDAHDVEAYEPIILINAEPAECAGDTYQPENRISPQKTIWYTAPAPEGLDLDAYKTGAALLDAINAAMQAGRGVSEYHLPVGDIDSVDYVEVDEEALEAGTDYTVDLEAGTVTFTTAPRFHWPARPNTVKITYSKANPDAMASIMECKYAAVFGGDQNVCVVLAGSPAQPNAYYWCGNHAAMDPGYFPMEQYNFAGDAEDSITGFGKQQNMLVIFKEHSVGRAAFGSTGMMTGRVLLTMDYTAINSRVGCDLPGTIQLIENNLVFANSEQGVHLIRDSSAAYENNIMCVSGKVNGHPLSRGVLYDLRRAARVTSFDDDQRYWLVIDGKVYCWDYSISGLSDPSWFLLTGMQGAAYVRGETACYHLDGRGGVSILRRTWQDYGEGIVKRYRFAAQHFGGYDRLKDVLRCVFTVRGDTDTTIDVDYDTDYGLRRDLTPIRAFNWRLSPRNLAYRFLGGTRFAVTAVRKPYCRHVRHFTMELSNRTPGQDMAVISAEVYYRYQARDR